MAQILRPSQKYLSKSLFTSSIDIGLSLLLLMPTTALAEGNNNNSNDPPPQTTGTSGGSRGCETQSEISSSSIPSLILLAPSQIYGQTLATRPTFAWFISNSASSQMEFRLYEYDQASKQSKLVKEIKDENFKSSPGIMVLSLSSPELLVGRRYLWQVELVCDVNRPSGNPFATAAMKVIPVQPDLNKQLSQTNNVLNKAILYNQADLWYNTLEIALTSKDEPKLRELKMFLLEQVANGSQTGLKEQIKVELTKSTIHQLQR
ncbi:DUF928 domain-containing protein [Nostoc sp. CHAB 5784]|uniref:DUF928 domain-containing protein n=1 Tax=Nostoc mirabile TaxID=2907820 RepID=UPI001E2CAC36|nr:DUF928 domain-containing protein [Nostoc mirabile]MCC5669915.1 DUF928 domain-containing protein [Nostoc mirabile CHAB5784]